MAFWPKRTTTVSPSSGAMKPRRRPSRQERPSDARIALASTFGDSQIGKEETNTISLQHATQILEQVASAECHVADKTLDGRSTRVLSATFKRAVSQITWWLAKANLVLTGAKEAVARFEQAERFFTEIMSKLDPKDEIEPQRKSAALPRLEPQREMPTSSYTDWDPREHAPAQASGVKIE